MDKILNLIQKNSQRLNLASNNMQGSPIWNKNKKLIVIYLRENKIYEVNVPTAVALFKLNKDNALLMLKEINKDLFEGKKL